MKFQRIALLTLFPVFFLGLLAWSSHLHDPHLFFMRNYEASILMAITIALTILAFNKTNSFLRMSLISLALLIVGVSLYKVVNFQYRKHMVLTAGETARATLGRHFVVGYTDLEALFPLISRGLIGGVFITQRNVEGYSMAEVRNEIAKMQKLRRKAGLPPLIITTDQEGGIISRLSPPLKHRPALASLISPDQSTQQLEALAEAYGEAQGQELADLGITVNFAPVVDLKIDHGNNLQDINSLISLRAISIDPVLTTKVARAYSRGLSRKGVMPTLKHFPGLGRVFEDTHHAAATLDTSRSVLMQQDWMPFRNIASETNSIIMLSHVVLHDVDSESPVSFSKIVVQSVLRDEWQYDGVLITDDLTMGAAFDRGLCDVTKKALNAGVDLLLVSYDSDKYYESMYCAMQALKIGVLDTRLLGQSRKRLLKQFRKP